MICLCRELKSHDFGSQESCLATLRTWSKNKSSGYVTKLVICRLISVMYGDVQQTLRLSSQGNMRLCSIDFEVRYWTQPKPSMPTWLDWLGDSLQVDLLGAVAVAVHLVSLRDGAGHVLA